MIILFRKTLLFFMVPFLSVYLLLGLGGWQSSDSSLPLKYSGDGLLGLAVAKHVAVNGGFYASNSHLGAPYGTTLHDFPAADGIHFLILGAMNFFSSGDYIKSFYYFYYLTFFLASFSACWVLHSLRLPYVFALCGALMFAFSPYHILRGPSHLFLSSYFIIPPVLWLAHEVCFRKTFLYLPNNQTRVSGALTASLIALASGLCGLYYAFFAAFTLCIAGTYGAFSSRSFKPVLNGLIAVFLVSLMLTIDLAPAIYHRVQNGANNSVGKRIPEESEIYGLKPIQLLMPTPGHRIQKFDYWSSRYAATAPLVNENQSGSLGLIPATGFLALIMVALFPFLERLKPQIQFVSSLNLSYVLFAVIGGIGSLFAYLITPQIRAVNRISIFISFVSITGLLLLIQTGLSFLPRRFSGKVTLWSLAILMTMFSLWDQNYSRAVINTNVWKDEYVSDQSFVHQLEGILPDGANVYQMPLIRFPESPPMHEMHDYHHFRGYVHSNKLRWSYGAMKGRDVSNLYERINELPVPNQVEYLRDLGFQGIYIDRRGYKDHAKSLERELSQLLNVEPIVSRNDELSFFRLDPNSKGTNGSGLDKLTWFGKGFYPLETASDGKKWAWSSGNADVIIYTPKNSAAKCSLGFTFDSLVSRRLEVFLNGEQLTAVTLRPGNPEKIELTVQLKTGFNTLKLQTDMPARRPNSSDRRLLAFSMTPPYISCILQ